MYSKVYSNSLLAIVFVPLLAGFTFTGHSSSHLLDVPDANDTAFVHAAADAGMLEVQLGKLAATKGSSADVKQFGQSMVADHTKANDELKALIAKFKTESESGGDAELKSWAKGKIPTLEHHLMMAQDMNKKIGTKQ